MNYYIKQSKIDGWGIFANKNFSEGEEIGHLVNVVEQKESNKDYFTSSLSYSLKTFLEKSELERYLNHSTFANAECKVINYSVSLFAIKPIKKDQEITVNYNDAYKKLDIAQIIYRKLHPFTIK